MALSVRFLNISISIFQSDPICMNLIAIDSGEEVTPCHSSKSTWPRKSPESTEINSVALPCMNETVGASPTVSVAKELFKYHLSHSWRRSIDSLLLDLQITRTRSICFTLLYTVSSWVRNVNPRNAQSRTRSCQ